MDISSVNSDLIRGNVTTIILGSLWSADKYGYEILKEIENKSDGQYSLKQATLYNQLKRLEKQGLISSYDGDPDDTGGGKRKYYALTAEGRAYLKKEKSEYEYSRTILDKLVSSQEFDFTSPIPFDASELRPYSKKTPEDKPKVVYKDKIVEKAVYFDRFGNEITEEEAKQLAEQARLEDEEEAKRLEELEQQAKIRDEEAKQREIEFNKQLQQRQEQFEESLKTQREYFDSQIKEKLALQNASHQQQMVRLTQENAQLQKTEQQLAEEQEARLQAEYQLQQIELERAYEEEQARIAEQNARIAAEEEAKRKREEQAKPSLTLEEMFAKLDAESEYKNQSAQQQKYILQDTVAQQIVEQNAEFNAFGGDFQPVSSTQSSIQDMFRQLDDKEAEIDKKQAEEEEFATLAIYEARKQMEKESAADVCVAELESTSSVYSAPQNDVYATAAVVSKPEETFEYETSTGNYREFFYSMTEKESAREQESEKPQSVPLEGDIKTRLYTKGFKVRPYDKGNTSEYYTFNFILSNRIRRDTFLIIMAFFVAEVAIMWASLANQISFKYFLPILVVGVALCFVPTIIYLVNPARRIRANFNFKLSLLNRAMAWIELTVVCILIGFFGVGASINDLNTILMAIVLPAVLLTNLPLSSLIYFLLYRTRKYHIA